MKKKTHATKKIFSQFVQKRYRCDTQTWECCSQVFSDKRLIDKHVSKYHYADISQLDTSTDDHTNNAEEKTCDREVILSNDATYPWLPPPLPDTDTSSTEEEQILLFYCYRDLPNVDEIDGWQKELGRRLRLTGKVRVGREGINGTVAGDSVTVKMYIDSVLSHPLFAGCMEESSFKQSSGNPGQRAFPQGFQVSKCEEIVSMGISSDLISHRDAGQHISAEVFHDILNRHLQGHASGAIFIDCRNFYESKIGKFTGAIAPDIRKFSVWPKYVDVNVDIFRDKSVYMYCTGGIRCERASAYLKSKDVCKDVYQLSGGIHKYLEQYPDGLYRGKLFVFDDRFTIKSNDTVISVCQYCGAPWDTYSACSGGAPSCRQYVLSCDQCRGLGHTACCDPCVTGSSVTGGGGKEQCQCTRSRVGVPKECHSPATPNT